MSSKTDIPRGTSVAIQKIEIKWNKGYRGAEAGTVRNALPRSLPFQPPKQDDNSWFQQAVMDAADDYSLVESWHNLENFEPAYLPVRLKFEEGFVWLKLNVMRGKIRPKNMDDWIVKLPIGQMATIHANAVFDGDHDRRYYEYAVHVGYSDIATLDLPLFRKIDFRHILY